MPDLTEAETHVMRVFKRITGCFGKEPRRDAVRGYSGIGMSLQGQGIKMPSEVLAETLVLLESKGLVNIDREKDVVTLTDAGYEYITKELD